MMQYVKIAAVATVVVFVMAWLDDRYGILPGGKEMTFGKKE